jgi:hypothetical protein
VRPGHWSAGGCLVILLFVWLPPARPGAAPGLPRQIDDAQFRRLIADFSEPGGFFRSDNLVSNEDTYPSVLPELVATVTPGGAYFGVGPDQNFTYIAALDPAVAFITDIRRGNLHLHLLYKALFEISGDRADFLSRLFSRPRPPGLDASSTVDELFAAVARQSPSDALHAATRTAVIERLTRARGLPLTAADADGIASVLEAFHAAGPEIAYSNTTSARGRYPTFRDLQVARDAAGRPRSYLASEASFRRVQSLQQRNLVVPLVGDFAGPRALRAAGAWVRAAGGTVSAFYTSNVEQYLFQDGLWDRFADTVATLPLDASSTFIRSCFNNNCAAGTVSRSSVLLDPIARLLKEAEAGRITSYADVLAYRPPVGR